MFNMGKIFFELPSHGGYQRPKPPHRGQKWHEGVNLLKKVFNQSFSTTSKTRPVTGPIRFQLRPQLRKIGPSDLQDHCWKDISNSRTTWKVLISIIYKSSNSKIQLTPLSMHSDGTGQQKLRHEVVLERIYQMLMTLIKP